MERENLRRNGVDLLVPADAGLEEVRGEMENLAGWLAEHRPAGSVNRQVVLGASVTRAIPLQVLAGLEERVILDSQGDAAGVAAKLIVTGANSAVVYGGLEEFRELERMVKWAGGLSLVHRSLDGSRARLELAEMVASVLSDLGYSPEAISAGLEEIVQGLEAVAEAA